ncbi:DUF1501 domain-containing protein [Fimbriimonas ginsengisoli]|uniref:Sulfatase n=1 Tax=Fimbriimonas ginsengisoli Gsoil 348 TaxID=661478 RepID=A0A068NQR7_FIMGI|nr:DUF1501 domain-containing protein [Fimbriimonas ginsengisoli]AIE83944.1 hypothetical protein OP10G_0576 [Fimbriimonas ginsengisoli Gsoil 348]
MSQYNHDDPFRDLFLSRRQLLGRMGNGFAALGLMGLLGETALGQTPAKAYNPLAPHKPPLPARAKRVIFLFMNGGPSQVDTFDPKPSLQKYAGQAIPLQLPTERRTGAALPSPYKFQKYGQSGIEVSEIFPNVAKHVDDMCVIRSMHADVPNHEPSLMLMNCGDARQIRPSMGSWVLYGLGTENQNLPGYIAMCPGGFPIQETQNWQAGFLPGVLAGTYIDPNQTDIDKIVENIKNHYTLPSEQRAQLDLVQKLNQKHLASRDHDPALEARIQSFELAYRMQTEATDAFDIGHESQATRDMYGPGNFARQCLMARRLAERGVRFIQLYHGAGQPWDSHDDIAEQHRNLAHESDQAIGALLTDLKQRGMLDETLVIWGGEFGRTPTVELPTPGANAGKMNGRDHNHYGFTYWMAGGGVKGGTVYGATDEFGFRAEQNPVHVHDLHATILHLLGFDHTKFTYRHAGRDFRLTDVYGNVVHELLA